MERRKGISLQRLMAIAWLVVLYGAATARADIHTDLKVRYRLDDAAMSSTATDSSTNNHNGTLNGGATFVPTSGRINGAVQFAGDGDYIDCPQIAATNNAQKLTVAFWLNTDERDDWDVLVSKFQDGNDLFTIQLGDEATHENGDDDLTVYIYNDSQSAEGRVWTEGDYLSDGKWVHIAVVYNGTLSGNTNRCKIYINGRLVPLEDTDTIPTDLYDATDPWWIGWQETANQLYSVEGKMDEFHLYTRALTASEVQDLYFQSEGSILFNGGLAAPNAKLENTSANILEGSDDVTICAWVYADGQGEGSAGVVTALDETGNGLLLRHNNTSSTLRFIAQWDETDGEWTLPATDGVWNAVAISYDNTNDTNDPKVRVNFEDVPASNVVPPDGMSAIAPGLGYCVGNLNGQNNTWQGRIAHLQFFNRDLSAAEKDGCLHDPGSVKHNLRLWLPSLNAEDVEDRSGNDFHGTATALETGRDAPPFDKRFVFGVTDEIRRQIVILANGSEPAVGVRGVGTRSKLTPHSDLKHGSTFITTEIAANGLSEVIEPTVRELYLDGNQNISDHPFSSPDPSETEIAVCHAIDIDGDAANVTECKIFDFKGTAVTVRNNTQELSRLVRMPRVRDNKISHTWSGIVSRAVDTQIDGNRIASVRNYGIRELSGSVQCGNNHVFGAHTAIQFEGGPSRSVGDRFSDAAYGFRILSNASGSHIADGTTEHCRLKNILIEAERVRIHNTRILVANTSDHHLGETNSGIQSIVGLHLTTNAIQTLVSDCDVEVGDYTFTYNDEPDTGVKGSTGIFVEAHNVIIDNLKIRGDASGASVANEIGVRVAVGRQGGDFYIDARGGGFDDTNDCVVKFDTPGTGQTYPTGQRWYILHAGLDVPVRITPGTVGWGSTLQIFRRSDSQSEWTEIPTNTTYPPP